MVLAEAVACAKANRGKTARGPSSLWAGQSGTHGTTCLLAAESFLNLISHSSSVSTVQGVALLPDHLEQRMPHVPRAMCPRGTFLQTLFVLVPLKSIVFTHLPLAAALKSDFHVYPGTSSQALLPGLALTCPPSDLHSSQCQELGIGTLQIRLQKAF